jgi:hypothetical protein
VEEGGGGSGWWGECYCWLTGLGVTRRGS